MHYIHARYATMPSARMGLDITSWEAYQFDLAVLLVGLGSERRANEAPSSGRKQERRSYYGAPVKEFASSLADWGF